MASGYTGTLVDAHNQFGCDIEVEEIVRILDASSVSYTLLSARRPCDQDDPFKAHQRVLEVQSRLPNRTGFLISTKIGGAGGSSPRALKTLQRADAELLAMSHGFAEVLVQHHETDDKNSVFKGLSLTLDSVQVRRVTELIRSRGKPLILHLELNDFESESAATIRDLKRLLKALDPLPVLLIHLGQMNSDEAADLLANHKNAHFILSTVDPLSQRGIESRKTRGETAQAGWVNIFDENGARFSRKNYDAYVSSLTFKREWLTILQKYPDRFVIGIESVYREPWLRAYGLKVTLWRGVLGQLSQETQLLVACSNAQRLWKLPISCEGT